MPVLLLLLFVVAGCSSSDPGSVSKPKPNPYLASPLYAITHFDPSQSDSTPYGPPRNSIVTVDLSTKPVVYGGPINNHPGRLNECRFTCGMWFGPGQLHTQGERTVDHRNQLPSSRHQPVVCTRLSPMQIFRTFGIAPAVGMERNQAWMRTETLFGAILQRALRQCDFMSLVITTMCFTRITEPPFTVSP
jgi:hypothetical protein